jgi:hypothetical protein
MRSAYAAQKPNLTRKKPMDGVETRPEGLEKGQFGPDWRNTQDWILSNSSRNVLNTSYTRHQLWSLESGSFPQILDQY